MDTTNAPVIIMSPPHPSNPVPHFASLCSTCTSRSQRHQTRRNPSTWSSDSSSTTRESTEPNVESQLTSQEQDDPPVYPPPPPYNKRRRDQHITPDPPAYASLAPSIPSGVPTVTIPITLRYTETLVLEDDGWSKVVCPTARKFKAYVTLYEGMEWEQFQRCLRRIKPDVTGGEGNGKGGVKEVRALRSNTKWEKILGRRSGVKFSEEGWEGVRATIFKGLVDKVVVFA